MQQLEIAAAVAADRFAFNKSQLQQFQLWAANSKVLNFMFIEDEYFVSGVVFKNSLMFEEAEKFTILYDGVLSI